MNKRFYFTFLLLWVIGVSVAHEFWLQPSKFLLKVGQKINAYIFVGEGFRGEPWPDTKDKVVKLTHYSASYRREVVDSIPENDQKRIHIRFDTEGNHLLAFNNKNKFIELDAKKFNHYLQTEGLGGAAKLRVERGEMQKSGREFYQRCVKTLVQVGSKQDSSFHINTGMMLELIAEQNPYALKAGEAITFTVLYKGVVLPSALVLVWKRINGKTYVKKYLSNAKGQITFDLNRQGRYMVSVVHMVPHTNPAEADWQSYWGSYTFGYY